MYNTYPTIDEAITAAEKYATENGPIEFDGMNCNHYKDDDEVECDGWDGFDRRCNCGNRRVSWDVEMNKDGSYYVSARAY
jgi:hypothetical protein